MGGWKIVVITRASGAGKTALTRRLFEDEKDHIVLESDVLWNEAFNNPESEYRQLRELWLRVSRDISQIGIPVVLCGSLNLVTAVASGRRRIWPAGKK